jgi:hypothetical protein
MEAPKAAAWKRLAGRRRPERPTGPCGRARRAGAAGLGGRSATACSPGAAIPTDSRRGYSKMRVHHAKMGRLRNVLRRFIRAPPSSSLTLLSLTLLSLTLLPLTLLHAPPGHPRPHARTPSRPLPFTSHTQNPAPALVPAAPPSPPGRSTASSTAHNRRRCPPAGRACIAGAGPRARRTSSTAARPGAMGAVFRDRARRRPAARSVRAAWGNAGTTQPSRL